MFPLAVDGQYLESPEPGSHGLTPMRYMTGLTPLWATGASGLTPYSFEANPFDVSFAPGQSGRPDSPLPSFDFDGLKRAADDEAAAGAVLKRPRLDQAGVGVSTSASSFAPDADTPSDRGRRASSPPTGSSVAPTPKALFDLPEPTPPLPMMRTSIAPGDISSSYLTAAPPPLPPVPPPPVAIAKARAPAKATVAKAKKAPAPRKPKATKGKAKAVVVAPMEPVLEAGADEAMDDDSLSIAGSSVDGAEAGKRKKRGAAPEEDKRKHFLERNRKAACKSRARRKEFIRASKCSRSR